MKTPESAIESELFGPEAVAFTGAQKRRVWHIEHASGGTLFADEIESMLPETQIKMLRVLETRQVNPLVTNNDKLQHHGINRAGYGRKH